VIRVAERFPRSDLAQVSEVHTATGRHVTKTVAFPKWVPAEVSRAAARLDEPMALAALRASPPSA
jgi:hypothetical protein